MEKDWGGIDPSEGCPQDGVVTEFRLASLPAAAQASLLAAPAALALVLAAKGGATGSEEWLPFALGTCLLTAGVIALSPSGVRRGPGLWACLAFVLLAAWSSASAGWAVLPGEATLEASRALFYAAVFTFTFIVVRRLRDAEIAIAALATTGALVVTYALFDLASSPNPDWFSEGRLAWPAGYPNAAAACALIPLFPLLGIAAERRLLAPLRALALAAAVGCAGLASLTESRGALVALVVAGPIALALAPERLRLLAPIALAAACLAPTLRTLHASLETGASAATSQAAHEVLLAMAAAAAIGLVYALADGRITLSRRAHRGVALAVLALVVALVGAGGGIALAHNAPSRISRAWDRFQQVDGVNDGNLHLFDSSTSNRYDFWRVALRDVQAHPLNGVGAGSFGPTYAKRGRSNELTAQAHGQGFELASTLGLPGLLLGLAIAAVGLVGLVRRVDRARSPIVAGGFVGAVFALAHAQVDWQWQVPSAAIPTVILLGVGAGLATRGPAIARRRRGAGAIVLAAAAVLWVLPVFWSARLTDRALRTGDAGSAELAATLNPFDPAPERARARIEGNLGNTAGAYRDALAATRRAPNDWTGWALAASFAPDPTTHAEACARARRAYPRLAACPQGAA